MPLDARGIIAAVEIAIYVPILVIGACLSFKHGFTRRAGWILLVFLSIIRIIGGITHVLSEQDPANITERIIYNIMESSGLSPLLIASLGFLGTVAQYSPLEDTAIIARGLRLAGTVSIVGLVLSIVGGTKAGSADSQSALDSASTLRHAGTILFVVVYVAIILATLFCWQNYDHVLKYRRQLLKGITATLPFLCVRLVYGALSSFAPTSVAFVDGHQVPAQNASNSGLAPFTSASPQWWIFLVMSVLMEYIAVLIYVGVGLATPLSKDLPEYGQAPLQSRDSGSEAYKMGAYQQPYNS